MSLRDKSLREVFDIFNLIDPIDIVISHSTEWIITTLSIYVKSINTHLCRKGDTFRTVPLVELSRIKRAILFKSSSGTLHFFIMVLKFDRIQAGEYQIIDGVKTVGYIIKKSSAKWILYKCNNPSLLGKPISVKKTLKELKIEAENLIQSVGVEVSENSAELDNLIKSVQTNSEKEVDKFKLMGEMLEKDYVINLNEYRQTEEGLEEVKHSYGSIPTEELVNSL